MRLSALILLVGLASTATAFAAQPAAKNGGRARAVGSSRAVGMATRSFTIAGASFTESEIIDARAQPGVDGRAAIMLTFDEAAAKRFSAILARNVTKEIKVVLDGTIAFGIPVAEAAAAQSTMLTGDFSIAQAEALARRISGKPPLPDSLEDGP
jgi:preprotein translocase subunit SecD